MKNHVSSEGKDEESDFFRGKEKNKEERQIIAFRFFNSKHFKKLLNNHDISMSCRKINLKIQTV